MKTMKENKINKTILKNEKNLDKVLNLLMSDIIEAIFFNDLINDLNLALQEEKEVAFQAPTFWNLILFSWKDTRLSRLCRISDTEKSSISLVNILNTIHDNRELFSYDLFHKRLKENKFIDSLLEEDRELSEEEINHDIKNYSNDPIIKKILIWRNSYFSHKSVRSSIDDFRNLKNEGLSYEEIKDFLNRCYQTVNKYLNKFSAVSWSSKIVGMEDYKSIIKYVKIGLQKYKEDMKKEIEKYGIKFT